MGGGGTTNSYYRKDYVETQEPQIEGTHKLEGGDGLKITLEGGQIKSISKARKIAKALSIIEEEMGIGETLFVLGNCFVCNDTNFETLDKTAMEVILRKHIETKQIQIED